MERATLRDSGHAIGTLVFIAIVRSDVVAWGRDSFVARLMETTGWV